MVEIADMKTKHRLQNLIDAGRLPHAIAIVGGTPATRGECAEWLAGVLACNVNNGSLLRIEPDGTQIKLEQAKSILDFLSLSRLSKSRMIVVEESQQLNAQAANALLKIVEEPPENSYFVLLSPSFSLLLPTLRSRTQVFRLPFEKSELSEVDPQLVKTVEQALGGLADRQRATWSTLVDQVKDRETALHAAQICQRILRNRAVEEVDSTRWLTWWKAAFQLEQDIMANMDRTLLFENFYYQAWR